MVLDQNYFQQDDVVFLAKDLIGSRFHTQIDGAYCVGVVTETEAYEGVTDKASHAYGGKFTSRTAVMYEPGGIAYIYFCYGMHFLFNVVTAKRGTPHAVLIRGMIPLKGIQIMQNRRGPHIPFREIANGPAKLTKAMGIDGRYNGTLLEEGHIWFDKSDKIAGHIEATKRIGIDYAGEDTFLPYRFVWNP